MQVIKHQPPEHIMNRACFFFICPLVIIKRLEQFFLRCNFGEYRLRILRKYSYCNIISRLLYLFAANEHLTAVRLLNTADKLQRRAFPDTVSSNHTKKFAFFDIQGNAANNIVPVSVIAKPDVLQRHLSFSSHAVLFRRIQICCLVVFHPIWKKPI